MKNLLSVVTAVAGLGLGIVQAFGSTSTQFNLLTWGAGQATAQLPSGAGVNPSGGDWLVFTGDDSSGYNPQGALSHNFADLTGAMGAAGFNMAPSLTGTLNLDFNQTGTNAWNVSVTGLSYSGQAAQTISMNQHLVTPGSLAALTPSYNVDGNGNAGAWSSGTAGGWTIQYDVDFYFDSIFNNNDNYTVDVTFNDAQQIGYLLPTSLLTTPGLAGVTLNDPANLYTGDFENYLLTQIAPRLPGNATYLLITQMVKTHPGFVSGDLSTTPSMLLIGNTTFAYTTSAIPEPMGLSLLGVGGMLLVRRRFN